MRYFIVIGIALAVALNAMAICKDRARTGWAQNYIVVDDAQGEPQMVLECKSTGVITVVSAALPSGR